MKSFPVYHVDAFSDRPFGGNPAGVVLEAQGMSDTQMQLIARELKHSETAFVLPSGRADYRVRFFTPVREVDLCGHASLAAAWVLATEGRIALGRVRQETLAGVLDVDVDRERVMVELAPPRVEPADIRPESLAAILGVRAVDTVHPLQKAYAGNWMLMVPLLDERMINLCSPAQGELAALSVELGVIGVYLFSAEPDGSWYGRCFAPACGIPEDPVTGTAAGALGGYLVLNGLAKGPMLRVRQGDAMGRPGEMLVAATAKEIRVGGPAVILSRGMLTF